MCGTLTNLWNDGSQKEFNAKSCALMHKFWYWYFTGTKMYMKFKDKIAEG